MVSVASRKPEEAILLHRNDISTVHLELPRTHLALKNSQMIHWSGCNLSQAATLQKKLHLSLKKTHTYLLRHA